MTKKGAATDSHDQFVKQIEEIKKENDHLRSLLLTDELTGLANKRFFFIQLEVETARSRRTGQPCTLIMMNIDNFTSINETFGRDAGDRLLINLGGIIWENIRPADFACRLEADEFSILMPTSHLLEGVVTAKSIQLAMAQPVSLLHPDISKRLTASFGLAVYEPSFKMTVDDFFKQAEMELFEAKKAGKNHISCGSVKKMEQNAVSEEEKTALFRLATNF